MTPMRESPKWKGVEPHVQEALVLQRAADGGHHFVAVDWLGEVVVGAFPEAVHGDLRLVGGGNHDAFRVRAGVLDVLQELQPVHPGHVDVQEGDVEPAPVCHGGRGVPGVDLQAEVLEARPNQHAARAVETVLFLVDDEYGTLQGKTPCPSGVMPGACRSASPRQTRVSPVIPRKSQTR